LHCVQEIISDEFFAKVFINLRARKTKLELKSNSSKILPVNCKFICSLSWSKITDKLAFN